MNTTCKHAVCPATISDTALCDCTLERIDYLTQCQEVERLELALQYYADESEWSGSPWKRLFNSTYRDGHGYETAKAVLNRNRREEDKQ